MGEAVNPEMFGGKARTLLKHPFAPARLEWVSLVTHPNLWRHQLIISGIPALAVQQVWDPILRHIEEEKFGGSAFNQSAEGSAFNQLHHSVMSQNFVYKPVQNSALASNAFAPCETTRSLLQPLCRDLRGKVKETSLTRPARKGKEREKFQEEYLGVRS